MEMFIRWHEDYQKSVQYATLCVHNTSCTDYSNLTQRHNSSQADKNYYLSSPEMSIFQHREVFVWGGRGS